VGVTTVATLPKGACPPARLTFVITDHGTTGVHGLVIQPSGAVQLDVAIASPYASFDGVSWDTVDGTPTTCRPSPAAISPQSPDPAAVNSQ